jgi:hypothetical protein
MLNRRLFALLIKETTELLRNRQLVIFLTISLVILRGILLKGTGLEVWWLHAIAMMGFATATLLVSANRYRKQLS